MYRRIVKKPSGAVVLHQPPHNRYKTCAGELYAACHGFFIRDAVENFALTGPGHWGHVDWTMLDFASLLQLGSRTA